jgi:RNA polymerase sigma-70 factor, ECF subfamily
VDETTRLALAAASGDRVALHSESDPAEGVVMRAAVDDLGADRRAAFVLTQVLGLSYAEAAKICEVTIGTIRSRVARARNDLITALGHAASG